MGAGPGTPSLPTVLPLKQGEVERPRRETLQISDMERWERDYSGGKVIPNQLMIHVMLRMADNTLIGIDALVDTGAQVNLIRKGVIPEKYFRTSLAPKRFTTASQKLMEGGLTDVRATALLQTRDVDTGESTTVECDITFYDSNLGGEALLSYEWLRKNDINVCCRKHGLQINLPEGPKWMAGLRARASVEGKVYTVQGESQGLGRRSPLIFPRPRPDSRPRRSPTDEYAVRRAFVEEIMEGLGVRPTWDCFATAGNARFANYFTKVEDALGQNWERGETLWMNPPWNLWPAVAEKVEGGTCECVCILPAWTKPWVQKIVGMGEKRMYFQEGVRMFEDKGGVCPGTRWGIWAIWIPRGERKMAEKEEVLKDCTYVPRWKPMRSVGGGDQKTSEIATECGTGEGGTRRGIPHKAGVELVFGDGRPDGGVGQSRVSGDHSR